MVTHTTANNANSIQKSNVQPNALSNIMMRFSDKPSLAYAQPVSEHFALSTAAY